MRSKKAKARATTRSEVLSLELTHLEERVLRMRKGSCLPLHARLTTSGGSDAELVAKVLEIEQRVLRAAPLHISPLSAKQKIVLALQQKNQ